MQDEPPLPDLDPGGWAPYLDPDERLVWTGAPDTGLRVDVIDVLVVPAGLSFAYVGADILLNAKDLTASPAVLHLLAGLHFAGGRFLLDIYYRRHTRYALTTKRALIARSAFWRKMLDHPLGAGTPVELIPGPKGSIRFGTPPPEKGRFKSPPGDTSWGFPPAGVLFERLADPGAVYELVRRITREAG